MSYVEGAAREALRSAQTDIAKARQHFWLVAGILGLIHLVTVHPYLSASRQIDGLELQVATSEALLAKLNPQIDRLEAAGQTVGSALRAHLSDATREMIDGLARLSMLV
jgi:hypothetical protein